MKQNQADNSSKYCWDTDWIFYRKSLCSCSKAGWPSCYPAATGC